MSSPQEIPPLRRGPVPGSGNRCVSVARGSVALAALAASILSCGSASRRTGPQGTDASPDDAGPSDGVVWPVDVGADLGRDAGVDAGPADASAADVGPDAPAVRDSRADAISGTDAGAYSRVGWTASSTPMPPQPPGPGAQGRENLDPVNALDGKVGTRWSIGDLHDSGPGAGPTAQKIGDQFTLDMKQPHTFSKVSFWAGGPQGKGGPDPRDYPGALAVTLSDDCVAFGPVVATGLEPQPGCLDDGKPCDQPFVIALPPATAARCVRLTLTKVLAAGGGIWWAIDEIYVYP